MEKIISAAQARDMILELVSPAGAETLPLAESVGRVLAEDMRAVLSMPPFDCSPYDGFALRGEDTVGAAPEKPIVLKITEEIPAGKSARYEVSEGFAAKILTGAPIPAGANAIVKYELTKYSDTQVEISTPVAPNSDVVPAGKDIKAGSLLAETGDTLTAPLIAMAAAQGFAALKVYRKPAVTILNTGTELQELGTALEEAKIYNSNAYMIAAYLSLKGADPFIGGIAADDPAVITARIRQLLERSDMVITTGGASGGDYDWALRAAELLGSRVLFRKIAMKPGGSMLAAVKDEKILLSLSGSPGAAVIGFIMAGLPCVYKLSGKKNYLPGSFLVHLAEPYDKISSVPLYIPGKLEIREGNAFFIRSKGESSGMGALLQGCDVIAEIPEGCSPMKAGDLIRVFMI